MVSSASARNLARPRRNDLAVLGGKTRICHGHSRIDLGPTARDTAVFDSRMLDRMLRTLRVECRLHMETLENSCGNGASDDRESGSMNRTRELVDCIGLGLFAS